MDYWIYLLGSPVYLYFLYRLNIIVIKALYSIYHRNTIKTKINDVYLEMREWENGTSRFGITSPNLSVGNLTETIANAYLFKSPSLIPQYKELQKIYNFVMKSEAINEFRKNELAFIFLHKGIISKVHMEDKLPYQVELKEKVK